MNSNHYSTQHYDTKETSKCISSHSLFVKSKTTQSITIRVKITNCKERLRNNSKSTRRERERKNLVQNIQQCERRRAQQSMCDVDKIWMQGATRSDYHDIVSSTITTRTI